MKIIIFAISLLIAGFNTSNENLCHDIHLSKCRIKYSEKHQSLQISLFMFLDDLEAALQEYGGDQLRLCSDREHPEAEVYIANYLNEMLRIKVNGEAASYQFLGKEPSEDLMGIWCYMEISDFEYPQQMTVSYDIFHELFNDQLNMLSVSAIFGKESYYSFGEKGQVENIEL